jgi:CRISPR type III-A-associated RAMP protein Csm4
MSQSLLVQLRPAGPWRLGPETGSRSRSGVVCHSDTLYSALTAAMLELGYMEEWLDQTARAAQPALSFSSLFPWQDSLLYVPAPSLCWPPVTPNRLRLSPAQLIPASLVGALISGVAIQESQWEVHGESRCLVRSGRKAPGPFRYALRSNVAVDRVEEGNVSLHRTACVEFGPNAGMWCLIQFSTAEDAEVWSKRVEAAFRLLGDTGIGGERHRGWGHFTIDRKREGTAAELLFGQNTQNSSGQVPYWWLLSLFRPGDSDQIDWTRGDYTHIDRSGRIESPSGQGGLKKQSRMVGEGSILVAGQPPVGSACDVAPEGFPHPVYRSGLALALPLWKAEA